MKDASEEEQIKIDTQEVSAHRTIVMWLFLATLAVTLFLAAIMLLAHWFNSEIITTLPVVVLAGVLGAFVSALNRIYAASEIFPSLKNNLLAEGFNGYLIAYSSIPPLVGAISATVLYLMFAGEVIYSPLFPAFDCEIEAGCDSFKNFFKHWSPDQANDYAKSIIWGFVAGFSERFVPDILNRVASQSDKE